MHCYTEQPTTSGGWLYHQIITTNGQMIFRFSKKVSETHQIPRIILSIFLKLRLQLFLEQLVMKQYNHHEMSSTVWLVLNLRQFHLFLSICNLIFPHFLLSYVGPRITWLTNIIASKSPQYHLL